MLSKGLVGGKGSGDPAPSAARSARDWSGPLAPTRNAARSRELLATRIPLDRDRADRARSLLDAEDIVSLHELWTFFADERTARRVGDLIERLDPPGSRFAEG